MGKEKEKRSEGDRHHVSHYYNDNDYPSTSYYNDIINPGDAHADNGCSNNGNSGATKLRDILPQSYTVTFPDEPLRVAADKMAQTEYSCLPVVDPSNPQHVVGIISSDDLFAARKLLSAEERTLERVLSVPVPFTKGVSTERFVRIIQKSKSA
jgi:hypothetical protein